MTSLYKMVQTDNYRKQRNCSLESPHFENYTILTRLTSISIGNHMISSAIWDKSAQVNFSD